MQPAAAAWLQSHVLGGRLGSMTEITRVLSAIEQGDPSAAQQLLPLVYDELRKLAAQRLAHEKPGQTLQAPVGVMEAYSRLGGNHAPRTNPNPPTPPPEWNTRCLFSAPAAGAVRPFLANGPRRKSRLKHGRHRQRVDLESECLVS